MKQRTATKILIAISLFTILANLASTSFAQSKLFVSTGGATNITQTTATLHGTGGFDASYPSGCTSFSGFSSTTGLPCDNGGGASNPTLPVTAYFRYSTRPIAPVYCNDIYGTSMLSTGDYRLNTLSSTVNRENFALSVINLRPNTTYYYCAIVSNRDTIAYGGASVVKEFHTNCNDTTIETKSATSVRSNSARLNGSYCSMKTVKTSFKYRQIPTNPQTTPPPWIKAGEVNHPLGDKSNVYGNISLNLAGLSPNQEYEFRAVAETSNENKESFIEKFKTIPGVPPPLPPCPYPRVYDSSNTCVLPPPPTCALPQVYFPPTNSCITPITCTLPQVRNPLTNTCGLPPTSVFCEAYPRDPWCLSEGTGGRAGSPWTITSGGELNLGQTATPPEYSIVRYQEGIETVFSRQIVASPEFAKLYGYQEGANLQTFAWDLSHLFAKMFGYVDGSGREIRVSVPDIAAYQLQLTGNKLTVYEYYANKIVDIRNITASFKNASGYEYYFRK